MCSKVIARFCVVLVNVFAVHATLSLRAEYTGAKLPSKSTDAAAFYDGAESIYLFAGYSLTEGFTDNILRYDIGSNSVANVGKMPSVGFEGTVQTDGENLYYFGAEGTAGSYGDVVQFNLASNEIRKVAAHPELITTTTRQTTFKFDDSNTVYWSMVTNKNSVIYALDLLTFELNLVTEISGFQPTSSVVVGDWAYLFGLATGSEHVWRFNKNSLTTEMVNTNDVDFPFVVHRAPVLVGNTAYLLGRFNGKTYTSLLQFKTTSDTFASFSVDNFPLDSAFKYYSGSSAAYVEKLDRIYYFGGYSVSNNSYNYHDDIWYVDLRPVPTDPPPSTTTTSLPETTPTSPVFTCEDKIDGMYPHPTECSMFIGCRDGVATEFECQPPLLFDPLSGTCDHPDVVDCSVSCTGKPDGRYPHPRDCSRFILCHAEALSVYQCSPPLLFDPVELKCDYPDVVNCSTSTLPAF